MQADERKAFIREHGLSDSESRYINATSEREFRERYRVREQPQPQRGRNDRAR